MPNLINLCYIGSIYLHGWHGRLSGLQYQIDDYARIGQIGSGAQITGTRGAKCRVTPWAGAASRAEATQIAAALEAYQGTTVRVGDDFARAFERVRIDSLTTTIKCGYGVTLPGGSQMLFKVEVDAVMEVLP